MESRAGPRVSGLSEPSSTSTSTVTAITLGSISTPSPDAPSPSAVAPTGAAPNGDTAYRCCTNGRGTDRSGSGGCSSYRCGTDRGGPARLRTRPVPNLLDTARDQITEPVDELSHATRQVEDERQQPEATRQELDRRGRTEYRRQADQVDRAEYGSCDRVETTDDHHRDDEDREGRVEGVGREPLALRTRASRRRNRP